jgi:hypothetical protein
MDAKIVVRADALFEAALGLVLLAGVATGALGGSDFPRPVGAAVLLVVGLLLLLLAGLIWTGRVGAKALAVGNALTTVVAVVWLAVVSGFSAAGVALVAIAAAGLAGLAIMQAATLRA